MNFLQNLSKKAFLKHDTCKLCKQILFVKLYMDIYTYRNMWFEILKKIQEFCAFCEMKLEVGNGAI